MMKPVKKSLLLFLTILLLLCSMSGFAWAAPAATHKVVRVGYLPEYGFSGGRDGKPLGGYCYDYLAEVAKYTGWTYEYIPCQWQEGLSLLQSGDLDLFGPMQKSEERMKLYDFSDREMGFEYGVLYAPEGSSIYYEDMDFFNGMRVGTDPSNAYNPFLEAYCKEKGITVQMVYGAIGKQGSTLADGTYDVVLCGSLYNIPDTTVVAKIAAEPYYFATTKGNTKIVNEFNDALHKIVAENMYFAAKLEEKYYHRQALARLAFTKEEAAYIKEHRKLKVVCEPDWTPIESYDQKMKRYEGIGIDLLKEISNISNIEFEFVPTESYEESMKLITEGKADLISGNTEWISDLPLVYTDSYLDVPIVLVGLENPRHLENMVGVALPSLKNRACAAVMEEYPQFSYKDYGNVLDGLKAVDEEKERFALVHTYRMDELMRQKGDHTYISVPTDVTFPLNLGIPADADPVLRQILNKAISRIEQEKVSSIVFANTVEQAYKAPLSRIIKENAIFTIGVLLFFFASLLLVILITARDRNRKLMAVAYVDPITELSTLAKFKLDTETFLKQEPPGTYMLVSFDIDKFKYINDIFGYEMGNQVLQSIGKAFFLHKGGETLLARANADVFLLLMRAERKGEFVQWTRNQALMWPVVGGCLPSYYRLIFNVGIYVIADCEKDIMGMIDYANIARKSIKDNRASTVAVYTKEMDELLESQKQITINMEGGLLREEFILYLQPKYSLTQKKVVGAEALVRWYYPGKGIVMPDSFIPLFERNGFIYKLDLYMFEQACKVIQKWKNEGNSCEDRCISVNLSKYSLNQETLIEELEKRILLYQVPAKYLEIELTENAVVENLDSLLGVMKRFKEIGFLVSIDDFGSGYSALNLLKDLPADILKIDKEFLANASDTEKGRMIVASVIDMAQKLKLITVAEGVETKEQANSLHEMGCDVAQGYYFARPMPVDEFERTASEIGR